MRVGSAAEAQLPDFAELMSEVAAFRNDRLRRRPSDRMLAKAAGVSPTTVGDWLRADRFPQQIDPLLAVLRAVRAQADRVGLARDPTVALLLDEQRWRRAYQVEAHRRADATRAAVQAEQGRAVLERMRPGLPLSEVTDPFHLEVHRAIEAAPGFEDTELPELPVYVPREHDRRLGEVVARAAEGASQIAVLVGGSSTGKTRACWEALDLLRRRDEPWRLWHPIAPTRPDALLAELDDIASYTVVWLNEAHFYLAPDKVGEQVAAGLRELLRAPERGPVLVLATLWPDHWETLTTRPRAGQPDPHAQARELLDGHKVKVPDAFTGAGLATLADHAEQDPRLAEAAGHARAGQITQYLAGVPALLDRYQEASPETEALIHAAMDARRLGAGPNLPLAWLAEAAPGYLTDPEWYQTGDDWLQRALEYAATWCNGIPGILTPVKTGAPRNQRDRRTSTATSSADGPMGGSATGVGQGPMYRLADYLDQYGRRHRTDQIPPIDFWTAAARADPGDLPVLAEAAWARGLYRDAAQLLKHAATHGRPHAVSLIDRLRTLHPADSRPAVHFATHLATLANHVTLATHATLANLDIPGTVAALLDRLHQTGAHEHIAVLLACDPAAHVPLHDPTGVAHLLKHLYQVGAHQQAVALAERAAAHAPLYRPDAVVDLLEALHQAGAHEQIAVLLARGPAALVVLGDLIIEEDVAGLLKALHRVGARRQVAGLIERVATLDPYDVAHVVQHLNWAGARHLAVALAEHAATQVSCSDTTPVGMLLTQLCLIEAYDQVLVLAERAARDTSDDPYAVADLLDTLHALVQHDVFAQQRQQFDCGDPWDELSDAWHPAYTRPSSQAVKAQEQIDALLTRDPAAHVSLDDPRAVARLLKSLNRVGAHLQVDELVARDPATHAPLDKPGGVGQLLRSLHEMGAHEQVARLLARDPAAHAPLNDTGGLVMLLRSLHEMGAHEQVARLLARDPIAHAPLNDTGGLVMLLYELHEMGAHEQVAIVAERAVAYVPRDDPHEVSRLLETLQEVRAHPQITVLAEWLPAAGHFDLFLTIGDHRERFRFGREPDGSPAAPWRWDNLA